MKKFIEALKNPAVTIFIWVLGAACVLGLFTHAIKLNDAPTIAALILLVIDSTLLYFRYKAKL